MDVPGACRVVKVTLGRLVILTSFLIPVAGTSVQAVIVLAGGSIVASIRGIVHGTSSITQSGALTRAALLLRLFMVSGFM